MATIILEVAGSLLGEALGSAAIGTAVGALGGYLIDQTIFAKSIEGARLSSMRPMSAEEGAALPKVYGAVRLSGTLIWATRFEEKKSTSRSGGKGGPKVNTYSYFANFAIALTEGEISLVRRVWVDGKEMDQSAINMRVYKGSASQLPDPLIEAKQGTGNAPAYRNTAYVVFEQFPLDTYGNRVPQFQFEVVRAIGTLAHNLKAVALIPGATEFGLSPVLITNEPSKGETRGLNRNCLRNQTDWQTSLDELQSLCPQLQHVAIVVPWFGADLRASHCSIRPGIMDRQGFNESDDWEAGGVSRTDAHLISRLGKCAAYGGTPSDQSVIAAIRDAKARGLKVTLYPFVMLDVQSDNILPDPYGGAKQAAYPWRGRITCHPAPYQPDSANRTAGATAQVTAFLGTAAAGSFSIKKNAVKYRGDADDWGYRRFILHLAHLALCADGVDTFLLGSELCSLTIIRDETDSFPFVEGLCALAGDLRTILGGGCTLTYGADWTEYFGHHPQDGSGDVYYHLDPLWAHPDIGAVGIDNYMPLSDWRDEDYSVPNPDGFAAPYDLNALKTQIAAGEGSEWYYASDADRTSRKRTPITDGAGKPWVYRYKDIAAWWANPHHNRKDGVESAVATLWQPRGKPLWFTELGCPAVDKGPNQPNVFPDAKSSEGAFPYFSDHGRCDLAQNRFLRAHLDYWAAHGGAMLDTNRLYVWAWDTRPFPEFPLNRTLWSDGDNWTSGHWLNGRLAGVALDELISAVLADFGVTNVDATEVDGFVSGFIVEEPTSARSILEPLLALYCVNAFESGTNLVFQSAARMNAEPLFIGEFVEPEETGPVKRQLQEMMEQPSRVEVNYRDPTLDYQAAMAFAERLDGKGTDNIAIPGMIDAGQAKSLAEDWLQKRRAGRRTVNFDLPWKYAALQAGDRIRLDASVPVKDYVITSIEDGATRRIEAKGLPRHIRYPDRAGLPMPPVLERAAVFGKPYFHLCDLPMWPGAENPVDQLRVAAFARPWSGASAYASPETSGFEPRTALVDRSVMGRLTQPLRGGPSGRLLANAVLEVELYFGALRSTTLPQLFNGANSALMATPDGSWEILQFLNAEEIQQDRWRLSGLLRGQCGTEREASQPREKDTPFILLDGTVLPAGLKMRETGLDLHWRIGASGQDFSDQYCSTVSMTGGIRALEPLEPVHIRSRIGRQGDLRISWIRRGRIDADNWLAPDIALGEERETYRIEIRNSGILIRSLTVDRPEWNYSAAQRLADYCSLATTIDFSVAMVSGTVGSGRFARALLNMEPKTL
ncbi:host specificity protein [Phyllobacterium sp. 628]|uniref:baseplate multidomain protein megatron n=1 Tax=Phyllobacterium sp. 628 TaxID=2718938 RepID=UPI00166257B4|nr:glycoside hydrolase/phage tail family protein [Phyllobacterium sp. 628]QND52404.1 host specificity protein [Phyllobacterium sp. 628]